MFSAHFEIVYTQLIEGVKIKILHQDESMVMTEFVLQKGARLPEHSHQSSHSAYLLQGKICLTTDNTAREFVQGDSWSMNKNICHTTEALEDSVVLEVFDSGHGHIGFPVPHQANMIEI